MYNPTLTASIKLIRFEKVKNLKNRNEKKKNKKKIEIKNKNKDK